MPEKDQLSTVHPVTTTDVEPGPLAALYAQVRAVLAQARQVAQRHVNQVMVQSYWQVGQIIVEHEQAGQARAAYGARVLQEVASRLSAEFGKGFSVANLRNFRQFYQTFTLDEIRYTPCSELSWSHFRMLMRVPDPTARQWYALEAVSQTWSVAALDRQISTLYYQRLLSSQNQNGVKAEATALIGRDAPPYPRDFIRDPYILEFLGGQPETGRKRAGVCQPLPTLAAYRSRVASRTSPRPGADRKRPRSTAMNRGCETLYKF